MPSALKRPFASATKAGAASVRRTSPMRIGTGPSAAAMMVPPVLGGEGALQQFGCDVGDAPAAVHRLAPEPAIGVRLAQAPLLHQLRLGPVDERPLLQRGLGLPEL